MEGEKNGHYAWDFRYYDWRWNIVADEKICPVKKRNTPQGVEGFAFFYSIVFFGWGAFLILLCILMHGEEEEIGRAHV